MKTALFIHRSVGANMLADADVRRVLTNVRLADIDANSNTFTTAEGEISSSALDLSSGNTNPDGLASFFERAAAEADASDELERFDVVAFKSCYTAAHIGSDEQLESYIQHYSGPIDGWIAAHPMQRFVVISPPPRRRLLTNRAGRKRARAFARWLREYAGRRPNVTYFDLFDLLADDGDLLKRAYRRPLLVDQHPNEVGSVKAGLGLAEALDRAAASQ